MIKNSLTLFILFICFGSFHAQTPLFESTWAYHERTIQLIDSAANEIDMECSSILFKRNKRRTVSPEKPSISHFTKNKYKGGMAILRETYKMGSERKIRILSVNGLPQIIKCKYKKMGYGGISKCTFVNLGNKTWQWNYLTYVDGKKVYKAETVHNWR